MADKAKCKRCEKPFLKKHGNQVYCSDRCFNLHFKQYRKDWKKDNPIIEKDYGKSGNRAYNNITQRCNNKSNPSFKLYGGRGITCDLTREEFMTIYFSTDTCTDCKCKLNDENRKAKDGRTLERIDPELGYTEKNLRILCRSCNSRRARGKRRGKR